MSAASDLASVTGIKRACRALAVSRATFYRRSKPSSGHRQPPTRPARALGAEQRDRVLAVLDSERFVDRAPAEVYATLLDEGTYLCSQRTMYRLLAGRAPVRERRNQARHPQHRKPELIATGPNQVWSWDITKLKGPAPFVYYYLYVILDIFSRYVVGWMVASRENAGLATRLIQETCDRQGIEPQTLVIHSDRGPAMVAKTTVQLLAGLGVDQSLSRPRVSNDNPFSEAQFKTVKYHPHFPDRFAGQDHAGDFLRAWMPWYNDEHRHAGIGLLTPADVHFGRSDEVLDRRQSVLDAAFAAHPERFPNGPPIVPRLAPAVYINPPVAAAAATTPPETGPTEVRAH
jgi:putative transposase